jgi:C4-dicarboxylate transporter DctM subunit
LFATIIDSAEILLNKICRVTNGVGVTFLALMMFLITIDVCLRFLNRSFTGTYEIIEFMVAVVVFCALAYTAVKKAHVSVDLVPSRFSPRTQTAIHSVTTLVSLGLCGMMTWTTAEWGIHQLIVGQAATMTNLPTYPFVWIAAFGLALFCLVLLMNLIRSFQALTGSRWQIWLAILSAIVLVLLVVAFAFWGKTLQLGISKATVGIFAVVILILIIFTGMPIAFVMALVGFLGYAYIVSPGAAFGSFGTALYNYAANFTMSVVPLFILMGEFAFRAGLTRQLYDTAYKWLGHLPGGMAMATIGGCAGFSSICGSTIATAATMGVVALPEMKRYKYDDALATGCVAAGGTLGIMIPPSIGFVVYGIIANTSIAKLFISGILPGILLAILFMIAIYVMCRRNLVLGPPGEKTSIKEKFVSFKGTWTVLLLFFLVIGGIYFGLFTPTEGAAVGAFGAFIVGIVRKHLSWHKFVESLLETGKITAMTMFILMCATVYSRLLTISGIPADVANFVSGLHLPPVAIISVILLVYLILGCFLNTLPMIIITVPIFLPIILAVGYDAIWFGVFGILVSEMGLITPPVGTNVFVIHGVAKDVPMYTIFRGCVPFLICEIVCTYILIFFPQIATWLPSTM